MSISTTENKPEDKRDKLKKLREYHQSALDSLGVPGGVFIPKMAYRPFGKTELHIAFFTSEISKGEDIYIEFANKDLVPDDPERRLYKWRFNPHFDEEYEKTEPHPTTGHIRYLVPVDELTLIPAIVETKTDGAELDFSAIPDPNLDLPFSEMTIRDYAAIHLKKAVSHKEWLNQIVTM
jgi:hypothetical protein